MDADGDNVTWSLGGTDSDDLSIDSSSGALTFDSPPNYESPTDAGRNNIYNVTVIATDDSSSALSSQLDVTVTVNDLNERPDISGGLTFVRYAENGMDSVQTYRATDDDGDTIIWSLPDTTFETDRDDFDISSSGELTFDSTPDYENPDDDNNDNVYRVTVRASDGSLSSDRNVTVSVTNRAPTFSSGPSSQMYAECGTGSVATYAASDPAGGTIAWSLPNTTFETDRDEFSISSSGELTFDSTPDYENPDDHNDDNVYKVTVRASDGNLHVDRNVTVTVTNRAPTFSSGPSSQSYAEGGTGSVATYAASEPCGGTITWSLPNTTFETDRDDFDVSSDGELTFESIPDYENPDDHNNDNVYRVTVRASDGNLHVDSERYRHRHEQGPDVLLRPVFTKLCRGRSRLRGDLPGIGPRRRHHYLVAAQHHLRDRPRRLRHLLERRTHLRFHSRLREPGRP